MMTEPKCTLFLTTYNWPEALNLCLQSILRQVVLPNEVIVADDGSGDETKILIEKMAVHFPIPLKHCWQEDDGYRINAVRNNAISEAQYPYVIQIDGDIILHPYFIHDHLKFARPNRFLVGRRLDVSEEVTRVFVKKGDFHFKNPFRNRLICTFHQRILYNEKSVRGVRGCNISFWKTDVYKVNGYDEDMTSKGPNDKEFAARLVNVGVKAFNVKFYAVCWHLFHHEGGRRTHYGDLKKKYDSVVDTGEYWCVNGIVKK